MTSPKAKKSSSPYTHHQCHIRLKRDILDTLILIIRNHLHISSLINLNSLLLVLIGIHTVIHTTAFNNGIAEIPFSPIHLSLNVLMPSPHHSIPSTPILSYHYLIWQLRQPILILDGRRQCLEGLVVWIIVRDGEAMR